MTPPKLKLEVIQLQILWNYKFTREFLKEHTICSGSYKVGSRGKMLRSFGTPVYSLEDVLYTPALFYVVRGCKKQRSHKLARGPPTLLSCCWPRPLPLLPATQSSRARVWQRLAHVWQRINTSHTAMWDDKLSVLVGVELSLLLPRGYFHVVEHGAHRVPFDSKFYPVIVIFFILNWQLKFSRCIKFLRFR